MRVVCRPLPCYVWAACTLCSVLQDTAMVQAGTQPAPLSQPYLSSLKRPQAYLWDAVARTALPFCSRVDKSAADFSTTTVTPSITICPSAFSYSTMLPPPLLTSAVSPAAPRDAASDNGDAPAPSEDPNPYSDEVGVNRRGLFPPLLVPLLLPPPYTARAATRFPLLPLGAKAVGANRSWMTSL